MERFSFKEVFGEESARNTVSILSDATDVLNDKKGFASKAAKKHVRFKTC